MGDSIGPSQKRSQLPDVSLFFIYFNFLTIYGTDAFFTHTLSPQLDAKLWHLSSNPNRLFFRSRDGAVTRAIASHQLNVEFGCCWFSSLLREVFPRVLWLSPLLKIQHFQISILA